MALISRADFGTLTREGTLISHEFGWHYLHKHRLPWDHNVPPSNNPFSGPSLEDFEKLPVFIVSRETLIYLDFTDEAADMIWERFKDFCTDCPESLRRQNRQMPHDPELFIGMAKAHIREKDDDSDYPSAPSLLSSLSSSASSFSSSRSLEAWRTTMTTTDIAQSLQKELGIPPHQNLKMSCKDALIEETESKWANLIEIQKFSAERGLAPRPAAQTDGEKGRKRKASCDEDSGFGRFGSKRQRDNSGDEDSGFGLGSGEDVEMEM